jgi:hypothetical protein
MRPSNFVSSTIFFSSDPAMTSAPSPTSQRTIHGSAATAASVRSLPGPCVCSGPLAAPASAAGAAAPSHSSRSSPASTAAGAAQLHILQRRAPQGPLPPPQAANTRPCSKSAQRRLLGHAAAAVAAVILACSVACSFAQHLTVSGSSGTWSTAALSQARIFGPGATSLPNAGVAIFAGGQCTSCNFCLRRFRIGYGY